MDFRGQESGLGGHNETVVGGIPNHFPSGCVFAGGIRVSVPIMGLGGAGKVLVVQFGRTSGLGANN